MTRLVMAGRRPRRGSWEIRLDPAWLRNQGDPVPSALLAEMLRALMDRYGIDARLVDVYAQAVRGETR